MDAITNKLTSMRISEELLNVNNDVTISDYKSSNTTIDCKLLDALHTKVYNDVMLAMSKKFESYISECNAKIQAMVDEKCIQSSMVISSATGNIPPNDDNINNRLSALEKQNAELQKSAEEKSIDIDQLIIDQKAIDIRSINNSEKISNIESETSGIKVEMTSLQTSLDEEIAKSTQTKLDQCVVPNRLEVLEVVCEDILIEQSFIKAAQEGIDSRINASDVRAGKLEARIDSTEQQGRKGILEFHEIPFQHARTRKEDTTEIIIDFCKYYLNITLNKYDISVSHRQIHPNEKKKQGSRYIPPIYCLFVNRSVATMILQRKSMLNNARNSRGDRYEIKENLTYDRRLLKERVDNELTTYQYSWVRNGTIFVKKSSRSRPIAVNSNEFLNKLINEENAAKTSKNADHPSSCTSNLASSHNTQPVSEYSSTNGPNSNYMYSSQTSLRNPRSATLNDFINARLRSANRTPRLNNTVFTNSSVNNLAV